jgi:ferredoxin
MKAIVDADACVGCGRCEELCPTVFTMVDDKAVVQVDPVPGAVEPECRQARDECPVDAISLE